MPTANAQFSPESKIILTKILERLQATDEIDVFEDRYHEFDGCCYMLQSAKNGSFQLSFALPRLEEGFKLQMLNNNARGAIAEAYANIASMVPPPNGFDISLQVDIVTMSRLNPNDQLYWAKQVSSIRLIVAGAPMRVHFNALSIGTSSFGPTIPLCQKAGQVFFLKPDADKITLIFPMRFVTPQDAAIGISFLQEFEEARRTPALGMSPTCSYSPPKAPPLELQGVAPQLIGDANGGYISFTLFQRHINGPQLEHVTWSFATFYHLISYHMKCCKVVLHSRLRNRMNGLVGILNARRLAHGPGAHPTISTKMPRKGISGKYINQGLPDPSPPLPTFQLPAAQAPLASTQLPCQSVASHEPKLIQPLPLSQTPQSASSMNARESYDSQDSQAQLKHPMQLSPSSILLRVADPVTFVPSHVTGVSDVPLPPTAQSNASNLSPSSTGLQKQVSTTNVGGRLLLVGLAVILIAMIMYL